MEQEAEETAGDAPGCGGLVFGAEAALLDLAEMTTGAGEKLANEAVEKAEALEPGAAQERIEKLTLDLDISKTGTEDGHTSCHTGSATQSKLKALKVQIEKHKLVNLIWDLDEKVKAMRRP